MGEARELPRVLAVAALCLAGALSAVAPATAAETFHTSPTAADDASCTEGDPCRLAYAVEEAVDGDSVSVGPGEYQLSLATLAISSEIDIGGDPGARPIIRTTTTAAVQVTPGAGPEARIHDLAIVGVNALLLESGTAERVYVATSRDAEVVAEDPAACFIRLGNQATTATIRDSVCWSNSLEGSSSAHALAVSVGDDGPEKVVRVRNVTAIASGLGGNGIDAKASAGSKLLVDVKNTIARSAGGYDVIAEIDNPEILSRSWVRMAGSNYDRVGEGGFEVDVTDADTEGNSSAVPLFVDSAIGDFREAAGSPTLDAGVDDALNGGVDIEGTGRAQPSCLGPHARPLPDAGAYERSPEGRCPDPPLPPPPPPEPPKPQFRILKLNLNKRSGKGSVQVEVPAAGIAGVTGSGVKFVTRKTTEAGVLTLPIQPWAITTVRLNKFGKTRVRLKVTFEPTAGGTPLLRSMRVLLKRNRPPR